MARTQVRSGDVEGGGLTRDQLNVITPGKAVIRRAIAGAGISLSSTGADAGTGDVTINLSVDTRISTINFVIEDNPITTGIKGDLLIGFPCTILGGYIWCNCDATQNVQLDIWKAAIGSYPPTSENTITGLSIPTIARGQNKGTISLTGWTTAIAANDVLRFNVQATDGAITRLQIALNIQKTA